MNLIICIVFIFSEFCIFTEFGAWKQLCVQNVVDSSTCIRGERLIVTYLLFLSVQEYFLTMVESLLDLHI